MKIPIPAIDLIGTSKKWLSALKTDAWYGRFRWHRLLTPFGVMGPWLFSAAYGLLQFYRPHKSMSMKRFVLAILIASLALGQEGAPVNQTAGGPPKGYAAINYYDGSGNAIYTCLAKSNVGQSTVTVSAISNANPASFTATAHGFGDFATHGATMTPTVKVAGLTGNWIPLNGVWKATVTSANAFTIAVDSTAYGAVTGTVAVTTLAPRWNLPVWVIFGGVFSVNSQLFSGMASAPGGAGVTNLTAGSTGENKTCSSRASYSYQ